MEPPDPRQIAALMAAVDDVTLEDRIVEEGVDTVLAQVFAEMARRFLPQRAPGRSAVVQYDIALRDGAVHSWQVSVADRACSVAPGSGTAPQVTALITLPKFMRMLTGSLDPMMAFMAGDLKIRGDLILAQQMLGWFDRAL